MPDISALLHQHFGFRDFRPGQREVIDELLTQGRALAVFPTGGGKSLCYQLPALALEGTALVVSPLIALMKDQIDFLQNRGIAAARLDSSLDANESRAVTDSLRNGTLKLLYVAPERFNNERFLDNLKRANISLFAVDEAHCISEWGHNFRPDYLKLAQFARDLEVPRILALTATATPQVAHSICEGFEIPPQASVNTGFYRPNLKFCLTPARGDKRRDLLLSRLQKRAAGSGIVYVTLQKTAEHLAAFLEQNGIETRAYHAGLEAENRHEIQNWWMESDARLVVATIAFGMGIDKSDVRYVYHFNLPKGLESYSQEIGRAGRDGKSSTVELLACPDDVPTLENFVYGDTPTRESLEALVEHLLGLGEEFAVNAYAMSQGFDVRQLVLKTTLTYLELTGVLRQGTPFYAAYEVRPIPNLPAMYSAFSEKAAIFLREVMATANVGRIWHKIDPEIAVEKLGTKREHIVRAMELLEEKGVAEVRAADARSRYHRLNAEEDAQAIVDDLVERFSRRESAEIARIQDVLNLVEHPGCQTNALVGYFGEIREQPCGHCSFCATGKVAKLPPQRPLPPLESSIDAGEVAELRAQYDAALGQPRQLARFLCGISSPAQSKARIGR
ncbi:MAG: RecQ family ATP-dependent DNA helicase, partial [Armatimonadetes bacterium]|nr:RecQ family ATP-dependent DNA helicase [Armatimonadota bacterium]